MLIGTTRVHRDGEIHTICCELLGQDVSHQIEPMIWAFRFGERLKRTIVDIICCSVAIDLIHMV